jgi:mono/diheme cytochrome c family protein
LTEIPEHLLKRSRERRAALGLGGDAPAGAPAESESAAAATPAPAAAATPAPRPAAPVEEPKPEPPKPEPEYIQAAKRRRKVPIWAMPVLVFMPLWGYMFVRTLEPPPAGETDPFVLGTTVYSRCSSCHGSTGEGSAAIPNFTDGHVQEVWPDWRDHMMWVRLGSEGWPSSTYGATKEQKAGGMPAWALTDQELAQVVLHERVLGGEDQGEIEADADYADLIAIANGEMTFEDAGLGPLSEEAGVPEDRLAS